MGEKSSAEHFFSVYCSVIAVLILYIGAKIYYRNGKWVNTATIDLDAGRRFYKDQDVEVAQVKGGWAKNLVKGIWS